jgi:hypothetical protein
MKTFDVTLEGFDPNTDETDHLVKWINAPSIETVRDFCSQMNWKYESITEMEYYWPLTIDDGVDYILDEV